MAEEIPTTAGPGVPQAPDAAPAEGQAETPPGQAPAGRSAEALLAEARPLLQAAGLLDAPAAAPQAPAAAPQAPAGGDAALGAVPPPEQIQQALQLLQQAQALEEQLVQAHQYHLQRSDPKQAEELAREHTLRTLQRQQLALWLQHQYQRALLEEPAREIFAERLIQAVQQVEPAANPDELRPMLQTAQNPQQALHAARLYIEMHRRLQLRQRAEARTDQGGPPTGGADSLAGKSSYELLAMAFRQSRRRA